MKALSKLRIGIVGCGAIGSRIATSIQKDKELNRLCSLAGLYDIDDEKMLSLTRKLKRPVNIMRTSLHDLIINCDCIVEAVNAKDTRPIIKEALKAKKNILAMSVGKLLNARDLFELARKNKCKILLPSGAIAGIDAIKAASLAHIKKIILTTRKPPIGFRNTAYFVQKGIDLSQIKKETVIFSGDVDTAVKLFPQNINVSATVALACQDKRKLHIRILTSPKYKTNSHEIEVQGDFGEIITRTDNVVCPDNPKTSYLAVLSRIQTLKQFCTGLLIGT